MSIHPLWRRLLPLAGGGALLGSLLGASLLISSAPPSAIEPAALEPAAPVTPCLAGVPDGVSREPRLAHARELVRSRPDHPESWLTLGQAWLRQAQRSGDAGYTWNASDCAEHALSLAAQHPGAVALLARVKLEAHDFRAARALALDVLARAPDDASALGTLSDAALELGDDSAASQAAQQLMDLHPGLPAYARASYLRWLHGQEPAAIELARLAIDAAGDPDEQEARAWTLVQAALLFWQQGDVDGAEAGHQLALAVRPGYAPALIGVGRVAASRGQWRSAADAFAAALAARPSVEAAGLLGDVQTRLGDDASAARSHARAEQLGRADPRSLSLFYSTRDRDPARALELARAESATRGDIYSADALAWALYRNGQHEQALQHSQRALALGTRDALLLFHQGAIQLALGRRASGEALLRRALQQNPHFDLNGAAEARRLLGRAA